MKKRMFGLALVMMVFASMGFVSAGIFFSDVDSNYNLGDMIDIDVSVDPVKEGYLLEVDLICEGTSILRFNNLPEDGLINIKLPLNFHTLDQVSGNCYFDANYAEDTRRSGEFEISKRLDVKLISDSFFVYPGESITISGSAKRLNGQAIDGEVEISIPLLKVLEVIVEDEVVEEEDEVVDEEVEVLETEEDSEEDVEDEVVEESEDEVVDEEVVEEESEEVVEEEVVSDVNAGSYYGKVENGEFSVTFNLREDTPAGDYRIDVLAFEKLGEERSSEGLTLANLEVFQVLNSIEIAISNQNLDPGNNLDIRVNLLDQTGREIDEDASIIIKNSEGERIFEKITKGQETMSYLVPTDLPSGYYDIQSSSLGLESFQKFFVNEKAIVSFELVEQTLIVTNVGNIPYNKDIEVELNGKSFVKAVELGLGQSKELELGGTNEEYNILVNDGDTEFSRSGVMLTGYSVNVDTSSDLGSLSLGGPIVWILIIVILALVVLFYMRNKFKKKSFAYFTDKFKKKGGSHDKGNGGHEKGKIDGEVDKIEKKVEEENKKAGSGSDVVKGSSMSAVAGVSGGNQAEQVLVLKGHKNKAVVIALKIKNKIGDFSKKSLESAVGAVYNKKGAVYEHGDFVFVVFSQLTTKNDKDEVEAARVANHMKMVLNQHNEKFKEKIDFGIGINNGEVINKMEHGKLKFTAMGNFIVVAKRLAESSNKQVLMTRESYQRGAGSIKADKIGEGKIFEVKDIIDTEGNKKFLKGFMERMGKGNS
jgi:hypothetical protein